MCRESIPGTVVCCLTTVTAFKPGGQKLCSYFIGEKLWSIQLLNYVYVYIYIYIYIYKNKFCQVTLKVASGGGSTPR